jgi:CheY-like chemotaxis protein
MNESILVVDSHEESRRALTALFEECGYPVVEARDGIEGLHVARTRMPALVVVDLWPFFSASMQMMERLRRDADTRHIGVLILTSAVAAEQRAAVVPGCAAYLEKPCEPVRILAEVTRLLPRPAPMEGAGRVGDAP